MVPGVPQESPVKYGVYAPVSMRTVLLLLIFNWPLPASNHDWIKTPLTAVTTLLVVRYPLVNVRLVTFILNPLLVTERLVALIVALVIFKSCFRLTVPFHQNSTGPLFMFSVP